MGNFEVSVAKLDKRFWKKKSLVTFLLSILVFFIHISSFHNYSDTGSAVSAFNMLLSNIIKEGFTRFAVPLFFIITGALFFRDYSNDRYAAKLKKRIKTLLIPYLMWNTIWLTFDIVTSYSFISRFFIGREKYDISLTNVLLSIFHYKSNLPFWFIFDLLVFVLFAPIIDFLTKNKRRAMIAVVAAELLCLMGWGLPVSIFHMDTSIVYFLIGALIGKYYLPYFLGQSSVKMRILGVIVLLGCGIHNVFFYDLITGPLQSALLVVQHLLCAWAFWNICDWIPDSSIAHRFSDYSFAVFAMHVNVSAVITKLLYLLLPKSEYIAGINFLGTVILTLLFIKGFCVIIRKWVPGLYKLLMGNR